MNDKVQSTNKKYTTKHSKVYQTILNSRCKDWIMEGN